MMQLFLDSIYDRSNHHKRDVWLSIKSFHDLSGVTFDFMEVAQWSEKKQDFLQSKLITPHPLLNQNSQVEALVSI